MVSATPLSTTASLSFYVPPHDGARAYQKINATPVTGERERNFSLQAHEVEIKNLRGNEAAATLDTVGYQLFNHPAKHTAFMSDAEIEKEYYPESIELIKRLTGASRVVLFDHTIRRRRPGVLDDSPDRRQPVAMTHIDQTTASSVARVHRHLPAGDVPELLKHRFQIINLWRPISHPAVDWPLALCDFRSVDPTKDILPVALVYPDREGETFGVVYNPKQKWTYFSGVTPQELILIKCFDSLQDGSVALYTPHTGFQDPATPEGTPLRESIELRALVFYD
ncbi:hypothetical protein B0H15DRAFT_866328 [Mycena belliarum]|uniref:Methyltransferase n=1 Tax=Mycena belliarum TaxID=1033014 RepID=A0AAD6XMJ4_9AGAR|nr:hypothetical protein B0H15DRAFT_866328 [Mycena belliae]